jgi:acyl carrier protein
MDDERPPVYDRLRATVVEVLHVDPAAVVPGAEFGADLDIDSLGLVELMQEVEDRFAIEVTEDDLSCIVTVDHAREIIEARTADRLGPPPA